MAEPLSPAILYSNLAKIWGVQQLEQSSSQTYNEAPGPSQPRVTDMAQIGVNTLLARLKQSVASARVSLSISPATVVSNEVVTVGVCGIPEEEIYPRGRTCAGLEEALQK